MQNKYFHCLQKIAFLFLFIACLSLGKMYAQIDLFTDYFKIRINNNGFITSMKNITKTPGPELEIKRSHCKYWI